MNKFVVFQVALRRVRSSDNWDWTGITSAWASLRGFRHALLSDHFFHEIPRFSVTAFALKLGWRMHFLYLKMYRAPSWDCRASKQPELMKTKQSRSQLRLPSKARTCAGRVYRTDNRRWRKPDYGLRIVPGRLSKLHCISDLPIQICRLTRIIISMTLFFNIIYVQYNWIQMILIIWQNISQ